MPKLSNDILRTQSLIDLLNAVGVPLTGVSTQRQTHYTCFLLETGLDILEWVNQLQHRLSLTRESCTRLLEDGMVALIQQVASTHPDCTKLVNECLLRWRIATLSGFSYIVAPEDGKIHVFFSNEVDLTPFNALHSSVFAITNNGLSVDLQAYLNLSNSPILILCGKNHSATYVLMKEQALRMTPLYFITRELADNKVEVTPYFRVPEPTTRCEYHFSLDVSESINKRGLLIQMKKNVISLGALLFDFEPDATLILSVFSDEDVTLGRYLKKDFKKLEEAVNSLETGSLTALNEAAYHRLNAFHSSDAFQQVLVFTDGVNTAGNDKETTQAIDNIASYLSQSSVKMARKKFFVVSTEISPSDKLSQMATLFGSRVVTSKDANFIQTLESAGLLIEWASCRDIFTVNTIGLENRESNVSDTYQLMLNRSGQFIALKSFIVPYDSQFSIEIKDGLGKSLLQKTKSVNSPGRESVRTTSQQWSFFNKKNNGVLDTLLMSMPLN